MIHQTDPQSTASRNTETPRRVLIVGGVAGGASCAARLRRLDESIEILMFDRGPYVSFANCGLPYYVGNVIPDESRLLVASREMFHERFNIEVHTETEVTSIDRKACTVTVCDARTGNTRLEHYDALGRWRERYKDGEPIDASGTLSDGTTITGTDGLRQYLKDNQPRFHRTLSLKLLGYALGRGELVSDERLIEEMLAGLGQGGRFSELVVKIVTSRQFCYHRGQALAQAPAAAEGP